MTLPSHKPIPRIQEPLLLGSWSQFRNDRLGLLERVSRECGDIGSFRMGPVRLIVLSSASLLQQVLIDLAPKTQTEIFFRSVVPVLGKTALPGIDGEHHRRLRRIMAPLFQPKRLLTYTGQIVACSEAMLDTLQDDAEVDVSHMMHVLTRNIIAKSMFNLEDTEEEGFFAAIRVAAEYVAHLVANPVAVPLVLPTPRNQRTRPALMLLRRKARELLEQARRRGPEAGDLLSLLLQARDEDGTGLSEEELVDQALTMYVAGHETTANALAWTWLLLSQHPEVQARLHAEVDTVLGGRAPTHEDLPRLPYTLQVIKEAMRLYPPAFLFGRTPVEDIEVEGYRIRKGDFILISPYVVHRNPKYFPEPTRFDPDRFTPENEKKLPRCAYMPFGMGPHICIGQYFAQLEMHLVLARWVQQLSVSYVPGPQVYPLPLATLGVSPFKVKMSRRKQAVALAS